MVVSKLKAIIQGGIVPGGDAPFQIIYGAPTGNEPAFHSPFGDLALSIPGRSKGPHCNTQFTVPGNMGMELAEEIHPVKALGRLYRTI